MQKQRVYIAYADGEETLAESLADPLRRAGYEVTHDGTVAVGESLLDVATQALASRDPIVLCATRKAVGSTWARQIVFAGHTSGPDRVFVVKMEKQAYVDDLAMRAKVARYCDDPSKALDELLHALTKHFPPTVNDQSHSESGKPATEVAAVHFLDQPAPSASLDIDALHRFRHQLRDEIATRHSAALTAWEFLARADLSFDRQQLTRTGALLFAQNPTTACKTAIVKCVRYHGVDRAAEREAITFDGTVPAQIVAAREFVAVRVRRGERPNADQAQSADIYDYPMVAVREIIANALVHRDYSSTDACVHVRLFHDRLEVSSPGTWLDRDLQGSAARSLAELDGESIKRNFRLAHVLSWIRLVEGEGSGIPTALRDCQATGSPMPTVIQAQGFVTVTLRPGQPYSSEHRHLENSVRPQQLPATTAPFVGRVVAIDNLTGLLDRRDRGAPGIVVVTGVAGVGKTALAVHWAHQIADRFPDGQLYTNLRGPDSSGALRRSAEAVTAFLEAFGVAPHAIPASEEAQFALYRSLLADRHALVVLDDAQDAEQVLPLLPGTPTCMTLITSRSKLTALAVHRSATTIVLDALSLEESLALLAARLGQDRIDAEPHAARELASYCNGLPLILAIEAERVESGQDRPLGLMIDKLRASYAVQMRI